MNGPAQLHRRRIAAAFVGVLLLAFALRAAHTARGLPYLHHWDEPHTGAPALEMLKRGSFDPQRFRYGSVTAYVFLATDAAYFLWSSREPDPLTGERPRIEDIRTQYGADWTWTISHPGYYRANRLVVALFGCGAIALLWGLAGRQRRTVALLAGALLAVLPNHIHHSVMISPDIPAAFFVLATVVLAVRHYDERRLAPLVGSFALAGIAIGTKYNSCAVLAVPLVALWLSRRAGGGVSGSWFASGPLIAIGAFLATTPYALIDPREFLDDVGLEVFHYSHLGHGPQTVAPGLPHLGRQLVFFAERLSWPLLVLGLIGLLREARSARGRLLLVFPLLAVALQVRTTVHFHRNMLGVYPFLAFGVGALLVDLLQLLQPRARRAAAIGILFLPLLLVPRTVSELRDALAPESRTVAAVQAGEMVRSEGWQRVGVDRHLRLHPLDLARIGCEVVVDDLPALLRQASRLDALLVPDAYSSRSADLAAESAAADELNAALRGAGLERLWGVGTGEVYLQKPARSPAVSILRGGRGN